MLERLGLGDARELGHVRTIGPADGRLGRPPEQKCNEQ
jgi:hypothetical protein